MNRPVISTSIKLVLGLAFMAFCLTTAIYLLSIDKVANTTQQGVLEASEIHVGEDLSHSLDLRLARQAVYPSSAMNLVKDLGTHGGVKKQIISFPISS
ncbi:hypothetical protein KW803_00265, partial [Candidatus Saccharibacteria bacterium]|nr:hypothetical protein [Candidatus Saccharibacteria bacterium]